MKPNIYPLPIEVQNRFENSELAVLDMLARTLHPTDAGPATNRRRTNSEEELERRAERLVNELHARGA